MTAGQFPNFLIIGAPKCGTTSLYRYLDQHPDIFFPRIKEPHYFAFADQQLDFKGPGVSINEAITDIDTYSGLFEGASGQKAAGEASALYLSSPTAPALIHATIPDVRLIAILRNPVDRAFSSFMHLRREGREPIADFSEALIAEEGRISDNWGFLWRYKQLGCYYEQLKRYYDIFDRRQLLILLYDDLRDHREDLFRKIFLHLGVDPNFSVDASLRHNVSGIPRSRLVYNTLGRNTLIRNLARQLMPEPLRLRISARMQKLLLRRETMDNETRQHLKDAYREDISKLQDLIQRDLSQWLE